MLLEAICNLCLTSGDHSRLSYLVSVRTGLISSVLNSPSVSPPTLALLCEAILDIAEFDGAVVAAHASGIAELKEVVLWGFEAFPTAGEEVLSEWARVRGAFARVLGRLGKLGREGEERVGEAVRGVAEAEIKAALAFVRGGANGEAGQLLFSSQVIGSEKLPAGAYFKIVEEGTTFGDDATRDFFVAVSGSVLELLMVGLASPDLGKRFRPDLDFEDPRNAIGEAYYLMGMKILKLCRGKGQEPGGDVLEVVSRCVSLVVFDWLIGEGAGPGGIDYDDSFTLVILDFLPLALSFGSVIVRVGELFEQFLGSQGGVSVEGGLGGGGGGAGEVGAEVIIAALLHAASGRVPPWALEYIPPSFEGIFVGMGGESGGAAGMIVNCTGVAGKIKWQGEGGWRPVGGIFVYRLKEAAVQDLLKCVNNCCRTRNWKELKNGLKMACGRKKKGKSYKLKPSLRSFENARDKKITKLEAKAIQQAANFAAAAAAAADDLATAAVAANKLAAAVKNAAGNVTTTAIVEAAADHAVVLRAAADRAAASGPVIDDDTTIKAEENHAIAPEATTDHAKAPDSNYSIMENKQLLAANNALIKQIEALKTKVETLTSANNALKAAAAKVTAAAT
ncbi:hypothetical protein TrRE_jg12558, partial [Triparma retinervis]